VASVWRHPPRFVRRGATRWRGSRSTVLGHLSPTRSIYPRVLANCGVASLCAEARSRSLSKHGPQVDLLTFLVCFHRNAKAAYSPGGYRAFIRESMHKCWL
jgi:hypothetical protein